MEYLTLGQILLIHSMVIDETGGSHGLRDRAALSVLKDLPRQAAFGKELYPTIFLKAAVYVRNIIAAHPFVDGNKRTAMVAASVFMENNGWRVMAREGEIEHFAHVIVREKLDLDAIAAWFKQHSRRVK